MTTGSQQVMISMKKCPYSLKDPDHPYCRGPGCVVWVAGEGITGGCRLMKKGGKK